MKPKISRAYTIRGISILGHVSVEGLSEERNNGDRVLGFPNCKTGFNKEFAGWESLIGCLGRWSYSVLFP